MRACRRYETAIGSLWLEETDGALTHVTSAPLPETDRDTALLQKAHAELSEYFAGARKSFTVPLNPQGTMFQRAVWAALRAIPYGETRSYGEIAAAIGKPNAARAVGGANNRNPLLIFTPCHRVIGANGALVGFAAGLNMKEALLALEKKYR